MLEQYFVIGIVFTAWAIGLLEGSGSIPLFRSFFHAFVLALAVGLFWPATAIWMLMRK